MSVSTRFEVGLPFFGLFLRGITAALVVAILDVVGPALFLYGLWTRRAWAPPVAVAFVGVFVLNSAVALFTLRAQLGVLPVLIPALVYLAMLGVILWQRSYFRQAPA